MVIHIFLLVLAGTVLLFSVNTLLLMVLLVRTALANFLRGILQLRIGLLLGGVRRRERLLIQKEVEIGIVPVVVIVIIILLELRLLLVCLIVQIV